jgi:hypothetical protein
VSQPVKSGVGGWLLVLCLLLVIVHPLDLGLAASAVVDSIALHGLPLALVLMTRVLVTAFGVAAGLALLGRRPAGPAMAKASLVLSAATSLFVYATPYWPNNRMPGDTPYYVAITLAYYAAWLAYLFRSERVKQTYS